MECGREMGVESEKIPCLDFSNNMLGLKEGSEEWKKMSKKVREACESHGCFLLIYEKSTKDLCEDMFMNMKALFDLPIETKQKHTSPRALRSYTCDCPINPLSESFGIDDAPFSDTAEAFTNLMWPQGNPTFCETLKTTNSKILELNFLILKMILEGYGLPKHYTSDIENMKSTSNFRMMKYHAPKSNKGGEAGAIPHTDKGALTILCQNGVHALQVLTKSEKWIPLNIPQEGCVVIVGDILKAWSNGRLRAVTHKVVMSGDKERYSFALFAVPKEEVKIEVPSELVDDKLYPLCYRPFYYGDYFNYYISTREQNALDIFAGV